MNDPRNPTTQINAYAVARDPGTICVIWDKTQTGTCKLTGIPGGNVRGVSCWQIRLKSDSATQYIEIDPTAGIHYLHNLQPAQEYEIRLGQSDTMMHFHTVASCGEVTTPAASIATEEDTNWHTSPEELLELLGDNATQFLGSSHNFKQED